MEINRNKWISKPYLCKIDPYSTNRHNIFVSKKICAILAVRVFIEFLSRTSELFSLFSSAVGTAIQNINDAPIYLLGLKMENLYDTDEILAETIIEHYKSEFIRSLFTIIGSIEIIGNKYLTFKGNPVGFL